MELERRTRVRYNAEEAIQYILDPGSESELSDLEDADDDTVLDKLPDPDDRVDYPMPSDEENDEATVQNEEADLILPSKKPVFKWKKREPELPDVSFSGADFTLPDNVDELTPIAYFKMFWDDSITENLVEQTNLYSVQLEGRSISTTKDEIEKLIGIQMKMGIVKMPNYELYWANGTRYEPIASVMPIKSYKKLRQFLHVSDNTKKDEPGNKENRLYKVQPVIDGVRQNCTRIEPEINHSIDEQIIPAKTKYSGIRQYNPKKPTKWGFKNFVRAGKSGIMYDFFIYGGAKSAGQEKCTAESVVLRLCKTLPKNCNHLMFFDNWFSTLSLLLELKSQGYPTVATIRKNRIAGCPLKSEKELKQSGRGSFDYRTDSQSELHMVRWLDNSCVQLVSTYAGVKASKTARRWNGKEKIHVDVQCPDMVRLYNESMGGVDLADMLISLYRTKIKSRRWYLKVLFHCVDIAKVNAWLLYRRHCRQQNILQKKQQSLLEFSQEISEGLIKCGKSGKRKAGRPSTERNEARIEKRGRKPDMPQPVKSVRLDSAHHWPEFRDTKNRCRNCKTGYSRVYCDKCKVCLCLNKQNNCFRDFHTK